MKIKSKFKDYYDAWLVYWIDEKVYFKREQKVFKTDFSFNWNSINLIIKKMTLKYIFIL